MEIVAGIANWQIIPDATLARDVCQHETDSVTLGFTQEGVS
jgi:hypothetical protein